MLKLSGTVGGRYSTGIWLASRDFTGRIPRLTGR
jgi:hypothetical protein